MDIRKHIGSKWLKAKDIDAKADTIVTISDVVIDQVEDEETGAIDELVAVRFAEIPRKQLGLNTTNGEVLEDMFGWETEDWPDNRIALYVDSDVKFRGKRVDAIRIRPRKPPAARARKASKPRPRRLALGASAVLEAARARKASKPRPPQGDQDGKRTTKRSKRRATRGDGD